MITIERIVAGWLCLAALAGAEVELTNGLILRGTVEGDPKAAATSYVGGNGAWSLTVRCESGPGLALYAWQVRRVTDAETVAVTPADAPTETFPADDLPPARPGRSILPFGWRGDGSGVYADAAAPQAWRPVWKAPLRSWAHSSPVIAGDRILVVDQPHRLVCFDRRDGRRLWARDNPAHLNRRDLGYPSSDFMWNTFRLTTPTPVTDGRHVFAHFGSGTVVCYDLDGTLRWSQQVGYSTHTLRGGTGGSPALLGDLLVVGGYKTDALVGIDARTGEKRWIFGDGQGPHCAVISGGAGGYGAIRVVTWQDRPAILTCTGFMVAADGTVLSRGIAQSNYGPTAAWGEGVIFVADIKSKEFLAARPQIGEAVQALWRLPGLGGISRSPLWHDQVLYIPGDKAVIACDPADGRRLAEAKVAGAWSSPVVAGDRLVVVDADRVQVFTTGKGLALERDLKTDLDMKNGCWGSGVTPVFDGNRWYMRDRQHLWCLAGGPVP